MKAQSGISHRMVDLALNYGNTLASVSRNLLRPAICKEGRCRDYVVAYLPVQRAGEKGEDMPLTSLNTLQQNDTVHRPKQAEEYTRVHPHMNGRN